MSKLITSPVKKFPGTVTLSDPLTFPQFCAYQDALEAAQELIDDGTTQQSRVDRVLLPGLCACVEKWELAGLNGVTPETFPATPRKSSAELVSWLVRELAALAREADETDPK